MTFHIKKKKNVIKQYISIFEVTCALISKIEFLKLKLILINKIALNIFI